MSNQEHIATYYALLYVNGDRFIGRFNQHWTRGPIESAMMFDTEAEADSAQQALLTEAADRIANKNNNADSFWFDIRGGLVVVVAIERVMRVKARQPEEPQWRHPDNVPS